MSNSIAKSQRNRFGTRPAQAHVTPTCRRLSHEEERDLAALIAKGNLDARNDMVQANLPLVKKIARDFQGRGLHLDDLIGEGNLGLIRAAEGFEPEFGTRFSTYATYWIKESIRCALINTTSTIRVPAHMFGLLTKWRRAEQALARERGSTPSFEEVASVLGLSEVQKELVKKAWQAQNFRPDGSEVLKTTSGTRHEAGNAVRASEAPLVDGDERLLLSQRLQRLEDRERIILALRYGLDGQEPLTHTQIGRRLGITREWARKIELRAIQKLGDDQIDCANGLKARRLFPARRGARHALPA